MKSINEILSGLISSDLKQAADELHQKCISTGFASLDKMTVKLDPGSINVIAARPCMGKLNFVLKIASHVALTESLPVVIFTMEKSSLIMATHLLNQTTKIGSFNIFHNKLTEGEEVILQAGVKQLEDAIIYIDDSPELNSKELYKLLMNIYEQHASLGLIVIDNLQLMLLDAKNQDTDYRIIMRSLKAIATEFNVPIIVLSKLKRKLEYRENKHPRLFDFPVATIWKNADRVIYLYRDEIYDTNSRDRGFTEVIVAKNRNGTIGTAKLAFDGLTGIFSDITS